MHIIAAVLYICIYLYIFFVNHRHGVLGEINLVRNTQLNHFMGGVGLLKTVLFIHCSQENISQLQLLINLVKMSVT